MENSINDIIQKCMQDRSCADKSEDMIYKIDGTTDNMYHCKYTGKCKYKIVTGLFGRILAVFRRILKYNAVINAT